MKDFKTNILLSSRNSRLLMRAMAVIFCICTAVWTSAQPPIVPPSEELNRPFGDADTEMFRSPPQVYHPETWFHFIGGNVAEKGITADLEAIAGAGFSGIQFFHGQFGGAWPGVEPQITCLSPSWEKALRYTAEECRRLGLRFTMQNCPGWAMSGGPWIEPSNAMRHLVWSRTDVDGDIAGKGIALPLPPSSSEDWCDYRDVAVLAFPTPKDDTNQPLQPLSVKGDGDLPWEDCLTGKAKKSLRLSPVSDDAPYRIEVTFPSAVTIRTVEFPRINSLNHGWCYDPGITVGIQAIAPDGSTQDILHAAIPQANWQDDRPISLACDETSGATTYRITIANRHDMTLSSLRFFSAARNNNWEAEAGWTLRSPVRSSESPQQSPETFVSAGQIRDLTAMTDAQGNLKDPTLTGKWTVLRIGHVNTGMRNGPAPPEGTGWECNKLSETGPDAHFAGYIGRLNSTTLAGGLLNGMLMDSWECRTQTWTADMEAEFERKSGYPLRRWLPAVFGYVLNDHETTARFLYDWRATIGELFADRFYGTMAKHAKENGLSITYEPAAGDIFPADIMEYYKYADVPMCEFWQPISDNDVGSINFKPIIPTVSAARLYGKPRVAAEAFTSFALTWDEHPEMLKEVWNLSSVEGVTHPVFHTYTHNPRTDFLPPGTSFGASIGTPFLRGQTWWKHISEFVAYLSRCSYLLERGQPVSDLLWYLGDEIHHKPDQLLPFPAGFKFDYCNPDILLNRLTVRNGLLCTPEGLSYRVLWIPDARRMLPQTLEKLRSLVRDGAIVVGDAPQGLATLADADVAQQRFTAAVSDLWGDARKPGVRKVGKGKVISGTTIDAALQTLKMTPDVTGGNALWMHRRIDGADWYFVCSPKDSAFKGTLDFRCSGNVEIWDPVTGETAPATVTRSEKGRTSVVLELPHAGSCFVVFRHAGNAKAVAKSAKAVTGNTKAVAGNTTSAIPLVAPWTLSFPSGWDAPASLQTAELKAWKDLDVSAEAKAFSGSVTYTATFEVDEADAVNRYEIDLGRVEMIAAVRVNGKLLRTLWASPYRLDITEAVQNGKNTLSIEVTSTWFNRLVYDAGQPESQRKTWTIKGPSKESPLRESGLLGPVKLHRINYE
jgi:hypothetical protein